MVICHKNLLTIDRAEQFPAKIGTTGKPTPVTDEATYNVLTPIITTVSFDSKIEVSFL